MIPIGFFLGLFGKKIFTATLFIIGTLVTFFVVSLIFYTTFLSSEQEAWVNWVVFIGCIVLGLLVGYLLAKCQRLGGALLGGLAGFMLGLALNTAIFVYAESEPLFWVVTIACAIAGAILSFFAYNHVIILGTSFTGSYLFIRGFSLYIGGFPNEFEIAKALENGSIDGIDPWFYLYLVFIIVLTILCAIV